MKTNKGKYIFWSVIGILVMTLPVLIYNIFNFGIFEQISATKMSFTFLIGISMVGLAALTKMKKKTGVWLFVIGVSLAIMGEASVQIGYSLLMIGGSMLLDQFVFNKLALKYKEAWYGEQGKQISYTREL